MNFYQVVPLYRAEMDFKIAHDTEALLECLDDDFSAVIDPVRKHANIEAYQKMKENTPEKD